MIRLHVIEDHPVIVDGIRQRVRHAPGGFTVTGTSASVSEFLSAADPGEFDLVILDLWLPGSDPPDNLLAVRRRYPDIPVVIYSQEDSPFWVRTMMENGARAYLLKNIGSREFRNSLEEVFRGKILSPVPTSGAASGSPVPDAGPAGIFLKPTERAVVQRVAGGATLKAIARERGITVSAVEKTVRLLRRKYRVKTNPELIRFLVENKLL